MLNIINKLQEFLEFKDFLIIQKKVKDLGKNALYLLSFYIESLATRFFPDDYKYIREFKKGTGALIYKKHLESEYMSCAFCRHIVPSMYHGYCFSCSRENPAECRQLLPGTYPFVHSHTDTMGKELTPWLFKEICSCFTRLDGQNYYRNFTSVRLDITVSTYEALEGIFNGIHYNNKPCHICASVDLEIYNNCLEKRRASGSTPCTLIFGEMCKSYKGSP